MNVWLIGATALLAGLVPCGWVLLRGRLTEAIVAGGSSLRNYVQADGELGYFQHHWAVYGREGEPCPGCNCAEGVRRIAQSGRSTFYCAKRQR